MERLAMETKNITDENIKKILELFPNVATEAKDENGNLKTAIDFEKLKQELSEVVIDGEESYDFTWVGKKEAMVEANRPIRKTLRPDRESSVDWENTENIYIEGDNLEALKLLQESYLGKIKMIYIDPPYNTGKDFVYRDNFTQDKESYEEELGAKDEYNNKLFQNTETNGRFHSDWCSMIYSRLKLARNLLSEDGVIFISIDDNEVRNLKNICDEVFNEDNFIANFIWEKKKKPSFLNKNLGTKCEYILCYAKERDNTDAFSVELTEQGKKYPFNNAGNGMAKLVFPPNSVLFKIHDCIIQPQDMSEGKIKTKLLNTLVIKNSRNENEMILEGEWRYSQTKLDEIVKNNEEIVISKIPFRPNHIKEGGEIKKMHNLLTIKHYNVETNEDADEEHNKIFGLNYFDYAKPSQMIKLLTKAFLYKSSNAVILDFFSGSATTAHAVMQLNAEDGGNRKFIMVQLHEKTDEKSEAYKAGYKNICEIGEERIRRAGKKIQEENPDKKIDIGFRVFKVDDTNMKDVYYTPNETSQTQLGMFESNIKEDRTDEDLLYGCLLDWGVELSLPHKVEVIDGKRVHIVNDTDLIACFEDSIPESVIRKIAEMKPTRVVFRDSSFSSDDNKINVEEIFKLITPDTRVKVI